MVHLRASFWFILLSLQYRGFSSVIFSSFSSSVSFNTITIFSWNKNISYTFPSFAETSLRYMYARRVNYCTLFLPMWMYLVPLRVRSRHRDHTSWFFLRDERASTFPLLAGVAFPRVRVPTRSPTLPHQRSVIAFKNRVSGWRTTIFQVIHAHRVTFHPAGIAIDVRERQGWIIDAFTRPFGTTWKFITNNHRASYGFSDHYIGWRMLRETEMLKDIIHCNIRDEPWRHAKLFIE